MDKYTLNRVTDAVIHILHKVETGWPQTSLDASYEQAIAQASQQREAGIKLYRNDAVFRAKVMYSVSQIRDALTSSGSES